MRKSLRAVIALLLIGVHFPCSAIDASVQYRFVKSRLEWINAQMAKGVSIVRIANRLGVRVSTVQDALYGRQPGTGREFYRGSALVGRPPVAERPGAVSLRPVEP